MARLTTWIVAVVVGVAATAQAGTAGMVGLWDFVGTATFAGGGGGGGAYPATGTFDFGGASVSFNGITDTFFGVNWTVVGGTLTDNGDGSYTGDLTLDWGANSYPVVVPWEITDLGGGTASVVTLDRDGDGTPGVAMSGGPFTGVNLAIDGTLTAIVPEPASLALVGGVLGWLALRRRSRRGGEASAG